MYTAYNLTQESKNLILSKFSPKFSNLVLHHITYKFGVKTGEELPPEVSEIKVVGFAQNENIECFVCSLDGETNRPSGGTYHITFSHSDSASPKDSNELLENGFEKVEPFSIVAVPAIN